MADLRLQMISVPVNDQDIALEFYTQKVGFEVIKDEPGDETPRWVEIALPGADIHLTLVLASDMFKPGTLQGTVLATANIKSVHAELLERGLDLSPIEHADWGSYAIFSDPDGNGWVVTQNPE